MHRTLNVALAAVGAVILVGVASARAQYADGAPRISMDEFKKLVAAGNVVVVDTRTADVFRLGHIPGAILLPLEGIPMWPATFETTVEKLKVSKKPVGTYCA